MYPRVEFEMTSEDLELILDASKPTPAMMIGGSLGSSPQENANAAWRSLGLKMGFDPWTVQGLRGKGQRFFTAVPIESQEARAERELKEKEEKFIARRQELENEIAEKNEELSKLIKSHEKIHNQ